MADPILDSDAVDSVIKSVSPEAPEYPGLLNTRQKGEPDGARYRVTAGVARALQRPGGIGGSTSGSGGDPGRSGLASLGDAEGRIPPHTGI